MNKKIKFRNYLFNKKELKSVINDTFLYFGTNCVTFLSDNLKELGFHYATQAGISLSIEDLKIPPKKANILRSGESKVKNLEIDYNRGKINTVERFQSIVDLWNQASDDLKEELIEFFKETDPLNPLYLMAFSGARGNISQIRQLVGMRGLMSDPKGQIMDIPILHNFREGLNNTDYIMSAYGARKGVVDTALRTADSGYLTRRLIDVAQDVIIRDKECYTNYSFNILKSKFKQKDFISKIIGRTSNETIKLFNTSEYIIKKGEIISLPIAKSLFLNKYIYGIKIRSPLLCKLTRSICANCYGWDLAYSEKVELGQAVGIIAAQSIGEPGTQLTMRTFHTGGTFVADPSRQIRLKDSGFIYFDSKTSDSDIVRTNYGIFAAFLNFKKVINIINFDNNILKFSLNPGTLFFVENNTYIRTRQLLAELSTGTEKTVPAKKYIFPKFSGFIQKRNKSNIVWILNGSVYPMIKNSFLNTLVLKQELSHRDSIFSFKLISNSFGMIFVNFNNLNGLIEEFKIFNILKVFNLPIYYDYKNTNAKLALTDRYKNLYRLKALNQIISNKIFTLSDNIGNKYKSVLGGNIFYPKQPFYQFDKKNQRVMTKNGKILYVPAEVNYFNRDASLLQVLNGSFLDDADIELVKNGVWSQCHGFVETKVSNKIIHKISIKPGKFMEYINLTPKEKKFLLTFNNKIFFPGEIVFEDVGVDFLSIVQITKFRKRIGLLIRPIYDYNIPKRKIRKREIISKQGVFSENYNILEYPLLSHSSNTYIETYKPVHLIKRFFFLNPKISLALLDRNKFYVKYRFLKSLKKTNYYYLCLAINEFIDLSKFLSTRLIDQKLKIALNTYSGQFIEPFTNLGSVLTVSDNYSHVFEIYKSFTNYRLMLVGKQHYLSYYNENLFRNNLVKKKKTINYNDFLSTNIKINTAGPIIKTTSFKCEIRKGTPIFISASTVTYVKFPSLIKKEDIFGHISFNQIITGDIIQGLPKVEEFLEGRNREREGIALADNPDYIFFAKVLNNNTKKKCLLFVRSATRHFLKESQLLIKKYNTPGSYLKFTTGDYLKIGDSISNKLVNIHNLLNTYFYYYTTINSLENAAYLSYRNIQFLLIEKVQNIYKGQGVTIADKHLEVIIRQMTSKVQITILNSCFWPKEIIELKHVNYINRTLIECNKPLIYYQLIILGLTRASLLTNSFISAASFQNTTKVLMESALEGKIDWLQGLKENVIVGRLIPSGKGFDFYSNFNISSLEKNH